MEEGADAKQISAPTTAMVRALAGGHCICGVLGQNSLLSQCGTAFLHSGEHCINQSINQSINRLFNVVGTLRDGPLNF